MISVAEALARIFSIATPLETEIIPLAEAAGRVLSKDVSAKLTQPPFASSAMDGYAVISAEAQSNMQLRVIGESAAGCRYVGTLKSGEAVRIFTGAPVPEGADCIVIQEDTIRDGDIITIQENRDQKPYIRPAGGDFSLGDKIKAPRRLSAADIALLASMNIAEVPVARKPVIALIPTGNELVMPGEAPGPDQIISSNNFGLKALFEQYGADVRLLPIARDTVESLQFVLGLCKGVDLIITLGGASVGDHDLVQSVATNKGLELGFYKVAMRPGKPLMAGVLDGVPMVGLPGNPVSSMVCGHIFLRPMINAMLGFTPAALPRQNARISQDLGANRDREHYMRAVVKYTDTGWELTPFKRQDSALLSVLGDSNALLVRQPNANIVNKGELVEFIMLA